MPDDDPSAAIPPQASARPGQAARRLCQARPVLAAVRRATDVVGAEGRWLLHAGPPLRDPCNPPMPLRSSAVLSCLHEGWAADEAEAERLIGRGAVVLRPAQDAGCLTPLAALISPGTPLLAVHDAAHPGHVAYAPLSPLRGADTRMGSRDPAVLGHLRSRDGVLQPRLAQRLAVTGPIGLWDCALAGLAGGDDLHAVTTAANTALAERLDAGLAAPAWAADLAATPLFFLTVWMAAARCLLRAMEGSDLSTAVTRGGANGEVFGLSLAAAPKVWHTTQATPPQGPRLPHANPVAAVCPAIGDSVVIDLLGLGAQALGPTSSAWPMLHDQLPPGQLAAQQAWAVARCAPGGADDLPLGVNAARVAGDKATPMVALAMIDKAGRAGLLGRGLIRTPVALYADALAAMHGSVAPPGHDPRGTLSQPPDP